MSYQAIKVKLDPTPAQIRTFISHIGAARYTWNNVLSYVNDQYELGNKINVASGYKLAEIWRSLRNEIAPWYKVNNPRCYQYSCFALARAFKNFFDGLNSKRQDKPGFPKFKKKSDKGSFTIETDHHLLEDDYAIKLDSKRLGV